MCFYSPKSCFKGLLCCLCCIIVVMGLVILALYFALRPTKPRFEVVDVQRAGDSPSLLSVSSEGMVMPYVNFILLSHNPNKVEIDYDANYTLNVYYGTNVTKERKIGEASLPSFSQGKKSDRNVTAAWLSPKVLEESLLSGLREDITNDLVIVSLTGTLHTKPVFIGLTFPRIKVELRCHVGFRPIAYALVSENTSCGVNIPVHQV